MGDRDAESTPLLDRQLLASPQVSNLNALPQFETTLSPQPRVAGGSNKRGSESLASWNHDGMCGKSHFFDRPSGSLKLGRVWVYLSIQCLLIDKERMAAPGDGPGDLLCRVSAISNIVTSFDSPQGTLMASEPGTPNLVPPPSVVEPDAHPQDVPVPLTESLDVPVSWLQKTLLSFGR